MRLAPGRGRAADGPAPGSRGGQGGRREQSFNERLDAALRSLGAKHKARRAQRERERPAEPEGPGAA